MGISLYTAMAIQGNDDIQASAGVPVTNMGPEFDGKFVGWITFGESKRYRELLNTKPIYDTPEAAKAAMQTVIDQVRSFDLSKEIGELNKLLDGK